MIRIPEDIGKILQELQSESIYAGEAYRKKTNNKLFESYLLLLTEGFPVKSVYKLLIRHQRECHEIFNKPDMIELYVKTMNAILTAQLLINYFLAEAIITKKEKTDPLKFEIIFSQKLLGFVFDRKYIYYSDENIKQSFIECMTNSSPYTYELLQSYEFVKDDNPSPKDLLERMF
jgi:hypothetical protein